MNDIIIPITSPGKRYGEFEIDGTTLVKYWGTSYLVVVPKGIETIGYRAFANNPNIKQVVLQDGVGLIQNEAFEDCVNLETVQLPRSLWNIGFDVFYNCPRLRSVSFGNPNGWVIGLHEMETFYLSRGELTSDTVAAALIRKYCCSMWEKYQ